MPGTMGLDSTTAFAGDGCLDPEVPWKMAGVGMFEAPAMGLFVSIVSNDRLKKTVVEAFYPKNGGHISVILSFL